MSRGDFPLSRNDSLILGRRWHWRVDLLQASGAQLRLLTAFDPSHQEFRAWLSYPRGDSHVIIVQLEFHGTHPGWHCHAACCDIDQIGAGQTRPRSFVRIPGPSSAHRRRDFEVTELSALVASFEFFRVRGVPEGLLI